MNKSHNENGEIIFIVVFFSHALPLFLPPDTWQVVAAKYGADLTKLVCLIDPENPMLNWERNVSGIMQNLMQFCSRKCSRQKERVRDRQRLSVSVVKKPWL
jgi:hypothetical protein